MSEKFLHPDKYLAMKYILAAFIIYTLDFFIPYLGFISIVLMYLGIPAFIHNENVHFSLAKKSLKKMIVAYLLYRLIGFIPHSESGEIVSEAVSLARLVGMGVSTIFFIYVTHHFTEGLLLDAKTKKVNFIKLGLNTPWIMFGLAVMLQFICYITFYMPIPAIVGAFTFFLGTFYSFKVFGAFPLIYGSPKKETPGNAN